MSNLKHKMEEIKKEQEAREKSSQLIKDTISNESIINVSDEPNVELRIVESLDYGHSLLNDGNIINPDGTIVSKEEYSFKKENQERNKLSWSVIDITDFMHMLDTCIFGTKTYSNEEDSGGITQSKMGYACLDNEGNPCYLRVIEFSSHETFEFSECNFSQLIYNISKNSSEEVFNSFVNSIEEYYKTKDQIGNTFSPEDGLDINMKTFIKDSYIWKMIFKNGVLTNIKKDKKLTVAQEVKPKQSKMATYITESNFSNIY